MSHLSSRPWVPADSESYVQSIASTAAASPTDQVVASVEALIETSERIHNVEGVNLNPATNTMSPRAAAALSGELGTRPSLGYPGAKYEMGLEAIEQIEVIAAEMAATVFSAQYAEVRVPSGALANLYSFMACAQSGDSILVPPATIAGHVTHHEAGAAGLFGLTIHEAPIDPNRYTIDTDRLATQAAEVRPAMITTGCSLNLTHHDVATIREIADSVGAIVLFDAAHLSGPIAGGAWPNPLDHGAHVMTMSTYKSLGGPPGGLLVTNDADIAERVDAIAFPGMTANFDAAKVAALAITLAEWTEFGATYAQTSIDCARLLAEQLQAAGVDVFRCGDTFTDSHAFALDATAHGGGGQLAIHLRQANLLTSAIGLPTGTDDGLRVGLNELVRWGATTADMPELATLLARAIGSGTPSELTGQVEAFRRRFSEIHFALPAKA